MSENIKHKSDPSSKRISNHLGARKALTCSWTSDNRDGSAGGLLIVRAPDSQISLGRQAQVMSAQPSLNLFLSSCHQVLPPSRNLLRRKGPTFRPNPDREPSQKQCTRILKKLTRAMPHSLRSQTPQIECDLQLRQQEATDA